MGKINLAPYENALEGEHLTALINQWLSTRRVDPATLAGYRQKVDYFVSWWEARGPTQDWRLTRRDLENFEIYLRGVVSFQSGKPLTWHTRNDVMRRLRQMFHWAFTSKRTEENYAHWVPAADGAAPERQAATPEQLARLMLAAGQSRMPMRDQAILATFIGTGVRLAELASLTVADLTMLADGSGTALVTGKRTKANPLGRRVVAFDNVTGRYLIAHMDHALIVRGGLWWTEAGKPFGRQGIYRMVKRTIAAAGLTEQIQACHDLRRAFATILGLMHPNAPGWADMIRRQLGHKSYRQTASYTLFQADDIREHIISPLAPPSTPQ